jgi:hypothetical protein
MSEKIKKIIIPLSIVLAGLIIAGAFIYISFLKKNEGTLSPEEVGAKTIDYVNKNFPAAQNSALLLEVIEEGNIYKIRLKIGDYEYDSFATKDGKYFFPDGYDMKEIAEEESSEETTTEIPTWDRPDVKLFVMSYCPYGLQAQKMFLPVYDLLKDKAEMGVYFVDYIMHGKDEIDENLNQYCIQKEEKEKYGDYLSCFAIDGDSEKCLSEAGIDRTKLTACVSATDNEYNVSEQYNDENTWLNGTYPVFDVNSDLNEEYSVQGSPTVVINDTVVNISPRSPEKFKEVICQAFTVQPEECSQALSADTFSPGFGGGTSSSSGGSCE